MCNIEGMVLSSVAWGFLPPVGGCGDPPFLYIGLCATTKLNLVLNVQHMLLLLKYCIIYLYNSMQILLM